MYYGSNGRHIAWPVATAGAAVGYASPSGDTHTDWEGTKGAVTLEVKGQHFPVAADIRYLYQHPFRVGPVYDASDVSHSLYSTH